MKKYFLKSFCWILALVIPLAADVPAPGVDMPDEVRDALARMADGSQNSDLARMMQQKKAARVLGTSTLADDVMRINVPLLLGRYSNSVDAFSRDDFQRQIFDDNPTGTMIDYYR